MGMYVYMNSGEEIQKVLMRRLFLSSHGMPLLDI